MLFQIFHRRLCRFAAAPALAQDADAPFTGPRLEVIGGYDNVQAGDDDSDDAAEGFTYGVALGYDVQLGGAVVGIEAELSDSTGKLTGHDIDIAGDSLRLDAGPRPSYRRARRLRCRPHDSALRQGRLHQFPRAHAL